MKRIYLTLTRLTISAMALGMVVGTASCKKEGCTDEDAINYEEKAKKDDGSCEYDVVEVNGEETVSGEIKIGFTIKGKL